MRLGTADVLVRAKTGQYKKDLDVTEARTKAFGRDASAAVKKVGLAFTALSTVGVVAFATASIKMLDFGSDLQETQGKFDVVFRGMTESAEAWAATLQDGYAMAETESKKYLSSIQDLLVPTGLAREEAGRLSNAFVQMAADLGSFNNRDTAEVVRDIQSALQGSSETMAKYGINVKAAKVEAEIFQTGLAKTKSEITDAHKAQAIYNIMMREGADAVGDMARTSTSYANQLKKAKANVTDLKTTIGEGLLPVASDIIIEFNDWFKINEKIISQDIKKWASDGANGAKELFNQIGSIKDIYESVPSEIVGPAGYGLVGAMLFGSNIGKLILVLKLTNDSMGILGNSMGDMASKTVATNNALWNLLNSITDAMGITEGAIYKTGTAITNTTAEIIAGLDTVSSHSPAAISAIEELNNALYPTNWDGWSDGAENVSNNLAKLTKEAQKAKDSLEELRVDKGLSDFFGSIDNEEKNIRKAPTDTYDIDYGSTEVAAAIELQNRLAQAMDDTYDVDFGNVTDGLYDLEETGVAVADSLSDAFAGWQNDYSYGLTKMITESGSSFREITGEYIKMLGEMYLQKQAIEPLLSFGTELLSKGFGMLTSSLFGGSGAVTAGSYSAPTYSMAGGGVINEHIIGTGLSSGASYEFGEGGIPEILLSSKDINKSSKTEQSAKTEPVTNITNVYIQAADAKSFNDMIKRNPGSIEMSISKALMGNSGLRKRMQGVL